MRTLLGLIFAVVVLAIVAIYTASEYGGEVVNLRTRDAEGTFQETHLWIVQNGTDLWLRSGDPESGWLVRLQQAPEVELERGGRVTRHRAVVVPTMGPQVDALMAEKYGLADRLIGLIRDPHQSVAVRLDPVSG